MPLRTRLPRSGIVLPGCLGRQREDGEVGGAGNFLFGLVADETDECHSIDVLKILLFCPCISGTQSEWARLPRAGAAFLGGPERASQRATRAPVLAVFGRRTKVVCKPKGGFGSIAVNWLPTLDTFRTCVGQLAV